MEINYNLEENKDPKCTALGFFDGLHKGHMAVIEKMQEKAKLQNLKSAIFTMDFKPNKNAVNKSLIFTAEKKINIIKNLDVDFLYIAAFSAINNLSAQEFVQQILIEKLNVKHIVCGFNFVFGYQKQGNTEVLKKLVKEFGISVDIIPPIFYKENLISSSYIKELIKNGENDLVKKLIYK